jgi:NhaA family Na+:H+ antiporter
MSEKSSIPRAVSLLREFSIPLIAGVLVALVWANVASDSYLHAIYDELWGFHSLHFFTNDLFMVLFFGIAAVEITSNLAPGGSLNPIRRAVNPLFATMGGVLTPVLCFFLFNRLGGGPELARGWGIPTATDIAIAWLVARGAFGAGHPCVSFLLLLAVADDAISLGIIAIFYPSLEHPVAPAWLLLTAVGVLIALGLRRWRVQSYWPYLVAGGSFAWAGLFLANLHPALALVFIVPFMPHQKAGDRESVFDEEDEGQRSTLAKFEHDWKLIVDMGMFLFGLCNAGVKFSAVGPITWIVLFSLLAGKTVGVVAFSYGARMIGFGLPAGVGFKELLVTGMISGIGLTVALFVAGEAFGTSQLQDAAKMGALASAAIGPVALILARAMNISRRAGKASAGAQ